MTLVSIALSERARLGELGSLNTEAVVDGWFRTFYDGRARSVAHISRCAWNAKPLHRPAQHSALYGKAPALGECEHRRACGRNDGMMGLAFRLLVRSLAGEPVNV
jgi:hypothetical protein